MENNVFEILIALISIISTLIGGTGAAVGIKAKNKSNNLEGANKSLEREIGEVKAEMKTHIDNQKELNKSIQKSLANLDSKIDSIKDILISRGDNNA